MLDQLGRRHGTDKWDASHSFLGESYLDVYERYLEPIRLQPLTVLELGVKSGGSLRMWKEYFPHGAIHGVDLNPRCQEATEDRITVHLLSQDDEVGLAALAEAVGGFDLVLDDASHINALTAASFRILWPHVRAGGFYIIEDLGMSWVDYARLQDQDTFMDGELKMNMDRGVSAQQDRSTLDAIFRDVLYGLDNRLGAARFLHFWHGTAILQRAPRVEPVIDHSVASLHLCLSDLLPTDQYRALVHRVTDVVARGCPDPSPPGADPVVDGFDADLGDSWNAFDAAIRAVAGLARRELGIPHFSIDGVEAHLTVHRDGAVCHSAAIGTPGPGTRRVDFVYTFSPDAEPADNAVVLFASGAPHDAVRPTSPHEGAVHYTLSGWLTGEPLWPFPSAP